MGRAAEFLVHREAIAEMCRRLGVARLDFCAWDPMINESDDQLLFMAHLVDDPNRSGFTFVRLEEEIGSMFAAPVYVRTTGERNSAGNFDSPVVIAVLFDAN